MQISEIPKNIFIYYPKFYYSFKSENKFSTWLKKRRSQYFLSDKKNWDGHLLKFLFGVPYYWPWLSKINFVDVSSILDVGCGNGSLIRQISASKTKRILGVDLFIEKDLKVANNCEIQKKTVFELSEKFDLIMMHDSLEHMSEQKEVLCKVASLMAVDATLIIRIPILGAAWEQNGVFWAGLDAPRHFFLHSQKSMKTLAEKANLSVTEILFDSNESQFILSEQYKTGISQVDGRSYARGKEKSGYTKAQIKSFQNQAQRRNELGVGDHAVFYLKAKN